MKILLLISQHYHLNLCFHSFLLFLVSFLLQVFVLHSKKLILQFLYYLKKYNLLNLVQYLQEGCPFLQINKIGMINIHPTRKLLFPMIKTEKNKTAHMEKIIRNILLYSVKKWNLILFI